jgi:hypothetical protein
MSIFKTSLLLILFWGLTSCSSFNQRFIASELDESLKAYIVRHMPNVQPEDIKLYNGFGKVDASDKHKLSYYVYTLNPHGANPKTTLIPMATSRFDRYNYHTDEWWDKYGEAYSNGEKVPMEDPEDVAKYLRANGLSTNPYVYQINNQTFAPSKIKLKDFLLKEYLANYSKNGYVYLYRGVAKDTEVETWLSGRVPRGVRYWTPDINYAWRYGRKRNDLIAGLIKDQSPMVQFKIPEREFIEMVRRNQVVLGTELPKSAHRSFEHQRFFKDSLNSYAYMGNEQYGVEFEVRARRQARKNMIRYFDGTVKVQDLAQDRIQKIRATYQRLMMIEPHRKDELTNLMNKRVETVSLETKIILASQDGMAAEELSELTRQMYGREAEITDTSRENLSSVTNSLSGKVSVSRTLSCDEILQQVLK